MIRWQQTHLVRCHILQLSWPNYSRLTLDLYNMLTTTSHRLYGLRHFTKPVGCGRSHIKTQQHNRFVEVVSCELLACVQVAAVTLNCGNEPWLTALQVGVEVEVEAAGKMGLGV